MVTTHAVALLAAGFLVNVSLAFAAPDTPVAVQLQPDFAALFYYKASGESFDYAAAAASSPAVMHANAFDKPNVEKAEEERLHKAFDLVDGTRLFSASISSRIGNYDFNAKAFSVDLFSPGRFVPLTAFNTQFRLIFENAEAFRALKMETDDARKFDASLDPGHAVSAIVYFRLVGAGDPTGVVPSTDAVRALVTKVRLTKNDGTLLKEIVAESAAPPPTVATKAPDEYDVHGLHLGMTEAALVDAAKAGFAGSNLTLKSDKPCGGASTFAATSPTVGNVCVVYDLKDGKVARFLVRQVLTLTATLRNDTRKALIDKFGAVTANDQSSYGFGDALGSRKPQDHVVFANLNYLGDAVSRDAGELGTPVLSITVTDPAFAQAQADNQPKPQTTAPKL